MRGDRSNARPLLLFLHVDAALLALALLPPPAAGTEVLAGADGARAGGAPDGGVALVVEAVRRYAEPRSEGSNPFGWRQYLKVQSLYLRFCWHDAVERLMRQERAQAAVLADGHNAEVPQ